MKKKYWLLTLIIFASGCFYPEKDFNLTEKEKQFLAPFKKGDTIYFESSKKDLTAIIVMGIDSDQKRESGWIMAKPAYNQVFVLIENLYFKKDDNGRFQVVPQDSALNNPDQLINIFKMPQQHKTEYSFSFRHASYDSETLPGDYHNDTTTLDGRKMFNYRVLKSTFTSGSPEDIECLYWKKDSGLIGYKFRDGTYWLRAATPM